MQQEKKYPIGGYAPGNYHCHCGTCGGGFIGNKRSYQCEPCALNDKAKFDALSPAEQEELVKKNAQAMNEMLSKVGTFTTESPSKEGNKEKEGEFAEWLYKNRWFSFENGKWHYTFEMGTAMSDKTYQKNYVKTTAQLYEQFKNRNNVND